MQFAVKPIAKMPVTPECPIPSMEQLTEAYEGMITAYMQLSDAQRDLDETCQIMANIEISLQALKSGDAAVLTMLNLDKGLESLLGVSADKITVGAATEGLGEALKNAWNKFCEFVKKIVVWIRDFIGKLFNTTGHQIRILEKNLDKVNYDTEVYVIKCEKVFIEHRVIAEILNACHAWMGKYNGYKYLADFPTSEQVGNINEPFIKRLSTAVGLSDGMFTIDEDSGHVNFNSGSYAKEHITLKDAGWTAENLNKICVNPIFSKAFYEYGDLVAQYSNIQASIGIEIAKMVTPSEKLRGYLTNARAFFSAEMSCFRALAGFNRFCIGVINAAYNTLPAEVKK